MTPQMIEHLLTGKQSHLDPRKALRDLDWQVAGRRVQQAPNSIYKILNHLVYWQDIYLQRISGVDAPAPARPSLGWPLGQTPEDGGAWSFAVARFEAGLETALKMARTWNLYDNIPTFRGITLAEALTYLAIHNSHHIGQIVTLRQALGAWPEARDVW